MFVSARFTKEKIAVSTVRMSCIFLRTWVYERKSYKSSLTFRLQTQSQPRFDIKYCLYWFLISSHCNFHFVLSQLTLHSRSCCCCCCLFCGTGDGIQYLAQTGQARTLPLSYTPSPKFYIFRSVKGCFSGTPNCKQYLISEVYFQKHRDNFIRGETNKPQKPTKNLRAGTL